MGWIPGWPTDPVAPKGALDPHAVVLHRTYGHWPGDYSVGKNQGLFQFLIGQDVGQYVQFMATESVAYHCNGANFRAFGVELTGTNDDVLTDWQCQKLGELLRYANTSHGIPLTYQDPFTTPQASISVNHSSFTGIISHVSVATDDGSSQHDDLVTPADYQRALGPPAPPPSPPATGGDMDLYTGHVNANTAIGPIPVPANTPLGLLVSPSGRIISTWAGPAVPPLNAPQGAVDWLNAGGRGKVNVISLDPPQIVEIISADAKTR